MEAEDITDPPKDSIVIQDDENSGNPQANGEQVHESDDTSPVVIKTEPSDPENSAPVQPNPEQPEGENADDAEPPSKKSKPDAPTEDYPEDEDEFPPEWREQAGQDEEEEDEGFEVTVDETAPRIDYRKTILNKKGIDFNEIPEINGVPVTEFNIDALEDKPWKKPGADISDYFNYGFNEDTWRIYCEKQRRMRSEAHHLEHTKSQIGTISKNDNSKYAAVPPPGQPAQPFRAQFRPRRDDMRPGQGMPMMPPMMMGNPFMPPMGPHGMVPSMMMGNMNRGPQQPQMPQRDMGGGRRQLTSIPLTSNKPDASS